MADLLDEDDCKASRQLERLRDPTGVEVGHRRQNRREHLVSGDRVGVFTAACLAVGHPLLGCRRELLPTGYLRVELPGVRFLFDHHRAELPVLRQIGVDAFDFLRVGRDLCDRALLRHGTEGLFF